MFAGWHGPADSAEQLHQGTGTQALAGYGDIAPVRSDGAQLGPDQAQAS